MREEIKQEEAGQNFAVGESSVMLQNWISDRSCYSWYFSFFLLTAI